MSGRLRVQVIAAWPRRFESVDLALEAGARVADAIAACGLDVGGVAGHAIHGERVTLDRRLRDGDRVELLRPLQVDPKQARRQRAARAKNSGQHE